MIRYALTYIGRDGLRVLANTNQGRNFSDTADDEEAALAAMLANNPPDKIAQIYGLNPQFQVRPIECYEMPDGSAGDAKRTVFPRWTLAPGRGLECDGKRVAYIGKEPNAYGGRTTRETDELAAAIVDALNMLGVQ